MVSTTATLCFKENAASYQISGNTLVFQKCSTPAHRARQAIQLL
jgi:hypothetical protein